MKKKHVIIVDLNNEPIIAQVLNELIDKPYYKMDYKEKKTNIWQRVSSKINNNTKCKRLIEEKFIEPPVTSRYQGFGMIVKKPNIEVIKMPFTSNKVKFIFNRKIF